MSIQPRFRKPAASLLLLVFIVSVTFVPVCTSTKTSKRKTHVPSPRPKHSSTGKKNGSSSSPPLPGYGSYDGNSNIFDVLSYGAKGDGKTDDSKAFLAAWKAACKVESAVVEVPAEFRFLVNPISFMGPCQPNIVFQGGLGSVSEVTFNNVYMENVRNPIIIDQFYCFTKGCKNKSEAVYVTNIAYQNIRGTYDVRSPPMHFACSDTVPCTNITLADIHLLPSQGQMVEDPFCWNAYGTIQTLTIPPVTCLLDGTPQSTVDSNIDSCSY